MLRELLISRSRTALLAFLFFVFALLPGTMRAVPAYPGTIILSQPDGTEFDARVRGDEFFGWYETTDGHPIAQDPTTKVWTYITDPATRQTKTLQQPKVVGADPPPSAPWTPQETGEAAQWREMADQSRQEILEATQAKSARRTRSASGPEQKKLLTVCVRFSDSPPPGELTPVSYFQDKIYGVTTDAALPKSTVADYYLEVSGNKLLVTGEAKGWVNLPQSTAYYGENITGSHAFPKYAELLREVVNSLGSAGFDFGDYDSDNDGLVDCLAIVFQGLGEADGGGPGTIWPHQFTYSELHGADAGAAPLPTGSTNAGGRPVSVDLYFTAAERNKDSRNAALSVRAPIGTFTHEFAHALGLPDLYDRAAPISRGLGNWSLMAHGTYASHFGQAGDCPTWIDPYNRMKMGWDTVVNVTANTLSARIPEVHTERKIYRVWTEGAAGHEYFLIENRRRLGFNRGQPGEGLLIYHVDESVTTDNDQEWYKPLSGGSRISRGNFLVALEQADGLFEMERAIDRGDAQDPFVTGSEFTDFSTPNSKTYNDPGTYLEGPPSRVAVRNINTSNPDAAYADIYVFEDQERPQVFITSPSNDGPAIEELTEATGTAFDNGELVALFAYIYEVGPGGKYYDWTAGTWRADFAEETRKQLTPESSWVLPMPAFPDGTYRLTVVAQDSTGLPSELAVSQFTIDTSLYAPRVAITSPSGETYAESPLVQGTSSTLEETTLTERRFALYSESSGQWFNWQEGIFDSATFAYATHAQVLADSAASWSFSLPSELTNGRYQIHAQSANDQNRGSAWTSASFVIVRSPKVAVTSITHQAWLQSMGALSGTAQPQGSYLLQEIRISIYRNGLYWNGSGWQEGAAYVTASVPPEGGAWTYGGSLPADDGLYAISVSAVDDQGSLSEPVAGGITGQNNILFNVDATPPSVNIEWPPPGHISTAQKIDAEDITGTATDGSGRPMVRVRIKRLADGLYWSRYGWTGSEVHAWYQGAFPGDDGGSQVQWVMEASLPEAGVDTSWCMPNGEYELSVEARDAAGNVSSATQDFTVDYVNPLLVGVEEVASLPGQQPVGPDPSTVGATLFAGETYTPENKLTDVHGLEAVSGGKYGVAASRTQSLNYGQSSRQPYLVSLSANSVAWNYRVEGPVLDTGLHREAGPPQVDFAQDGSGVSAIGLIEYDFTSSRYEGVPQCEVSRVGANGVLLWTQVIPPQSETTWQGGADSSALVVEAVRLLPDGQTLVVGRLSAHNAPYYGGPTNYREHVMVMLLDGAGALRWTARFGEESEDELLHENETFRFLEPDGFGSVFLATRRTTATGPEQVLRKIRLSDGLTFSEFISDTCLASETWGALAVDATGRPIIAGGMKFGEGDVRLVVQRLSANDLIADWRAYGPVQSSSYDATWATPPEIPLLYAGAHGITVVHNSPGSNGTYNDGNDLLFVTRFDSEGAHQWSREVDAPAGSGSRADMGMVTAAGDVLLTGYFATGTYDWQRCYAKVSGNGDLQFVKNLADEFDLSFGSTLTAAPAGTGDRLAVLYLSPDKTSLQVRLLENPANVVLPPDLDASRPADVSVAVGSAFALEAINTGSLATFQWYRQTGDGSFEAIAGATSPHYVVESATESDAGNYRAVAFNSAGEATTRTALVSIVTAPPEITSELAVTAYTGEYFSYQITAENAPSSFGVVFDSANYPDGLSAGPDGAITGFPNAAGTYEIQISAANPLGSDAKVLVLTVEDRPLTTLGEALDAVELSWTTAVAPNDWFVQDYYQAVGTHAVWTFAAPESTNWIETQISGPGTLSFWWGAYVAEGLADRLFLYLDGVQQASVGSSGYVLQSLEVPAGTHTVRWSLQSGADGDGSTTGYLDGVTFTPSGGGSFVSWASQNGLSGNDALPGAIPRGDGIANLLKYAFGMDPSVAQNGSERQLQPGTGTSGLPDVRMAESGGAAKLRVEFVRRRGSSGITYTVEFAGDLGSAGTWASSQETPVVTPIDDEWERVVVQDDVTRSQARRRFARVVVVESP